MDALFLDPLRKKAAAKRDAAIRAATDKAHAEYDADIQGIERTARLAAGEIDNNEPRQVERLTTEENTQVAPISSLSNGVKVSPLGITREAIETLDREFTVGEIDAFVAREHPNADINRAAISSALHRLGKLGEIEIVVKAQGRRAGVYRRKQEGVGEGLMVQEDHSI